MQTDSSAHKEPELEGDEDICYFILPGLLTIKHRLALNRKTNTLSLLADGPLLVQQQQLSVAEMLTLLPILNTFPYACPYEVLLASISSANAAPTSISYWQQRLKEAQNQGAWQQELKSVRRTLSSLRHKLRAFHLEISTVRQMGYSLTQEIENIKSAPLYR